MTDIQVGTNKTSNKENQKNDINRPKDNKGNKMIPPKFENGEGKPVR